MTQPCESGCPDTRMHYEGCSKHDPDSCVVCLRNAALETAAEVIESYVDKSHGIRYIDTYRRIAAKIRALKKDL